MNAHSQVHAPSSQSFQSILSAASHRFSSMDGSAATSSFLQDRWLFAVAQL